jgi:long-chain acyl-CoA synthetase
MPAQQDWKSPLDYLYEREQNIPDRVYLRQPKDGVYYTLTWGQVADQARRMATALRDIGIKPGEHVGILSKNCAEWIVVDLAIMMAGCVSIPIYATANAGTISHVLEHSGSKAIFVGKLDDWERQSEGIPDAVIRIAMPYPTMEAQHQWQELLEQHQPMADPAHLEADQVMTILYTSGSTGQPKGAVHTYHNFLFAGQRIGEQLGAGPDERILSYLPMAHCTERAYVESSSLIHGGEVWFTESLDTFSENLIATQPTFFGSVPRLWKQFQLGILRKMPAEKLSRLLRIPVVRGIVQRSIRKKMGLQHARWFMSGSAPIAPSLLQWWADLGMPLAEGWGMTETMAYGAMLPAGGKIKTGTIGKVAPDSEIKVSEQGEILIKTGALMNGYYKDPEQTAEAITEDGFLRTGDVGDIDDEGYIRITGRIKEIFKTAKGKYVAPVPIESKICRNAYVEQACLMGSGMKQPVALIEPSDIARQLGRDELGRELEETRTQVNQLLESHERIDRFFVVKDAWTVESGLLTPTLKVKRNIMEKQFASLVEADYEESIVFESD